MAMSERFAKGGVVPPGQSLVMKDEGCPAERVLSPREFARHRELLERLRRLLDDDA